jgi:CBS domain-containing protein
MRAAGDPATRPRFGVPPWSALCFCDWREPYWLLRWTGEEDVMRVQDVMTGGVKTIAPAAAAEDAWNLMRVHRIHHLVVTESRQVVGLLSDRDAGGKRGASLRANHTVADLMTAPVVTVDRATTVRQAANLMRGRSIGCLVVVDGSRAVGIVTVSDLLELVGRGSARGVEAPRRPALSHRVPHRKSKGVVAAW